jgi:hypothetical protein
MPGRPRSDMSECLKVIRPRRSLGAPSRNRTYDPLLKREMLYQLSYGRMIAKLYHSLAKVQFETDYKG